jgi:hypothetical protein
VYGTDEECQPMIKLPKVFVVVAECDIRNHELSCVSQLEVDKRDLEPEPALFTWGASCDKKL